MSEAPIAGQARGRSAWIRILGLDPASAGPTGFGIIEGDGRKCRVLHFGALQVGTKRRRECEGAVLQAVHDHVCGLLKEFMPDAMAVESVFTALNMRTALRLAEVRGVILLAAAQHSVEVYSYAPREVKASVAGHGHADKSQMQLMVKALLSMREIPEPSDAADALAVALCHLQREQARRRFDLPDIDAAPKPRGLRAAAGLSSKLPDEIRPLGATRGRLPRIISTQ